MTVACSASNGAHRTRADGERQAREQSKRLHALALNHGGARGRSARRAMGRLLGASRRAEAGYVRDLVGILGAEHRAVLAHVEPRLEEVRQDDVGKGGVLRRLFDRLFVFTRSRTGAAFDRMASEVARSNARGLTLIGIDPHAAGDEVHRYFAAARDRNIDLVENAARTYARDVRRVLGDPNNVGRRVEEIRDRLMDRGRVSLSRATLIARDQTLKTNAGLARARHQAAGGSRYRWSTSHDERVRPAHAALDGQTFSYDDPPTTNADGDTNNPGDDYQCRCIAIPILEDVDGEEGGGGITALLRSIPTPSD